MGLGDLFKKKDKVDKQLQQSTPSQEAPPLPDGNISSENIDIPIPNTDQPSITSEEIPDPLTNAQSPEMITDDNPPLLPQEKMDVSLQTQPEQSSSSEISLDTSIEQEQPVENPSLNETTVVDENQDSSFDSLPDFDDIHETSDYSSDNTMEEVPEEEVPSFKSESLLIKSIFVERDHYASMLVSIKEVKQSITTNSPLYRKLSAVDTKLSKSLNKLNGLFEESNEQLMQIESILAKEEL